MLDLKVQKRRLADYQRKVEEAAAAAANKARQLVAARSRDRALVELRRKKYMVRPEARTALRDHARRRPREAANDQHRLHIAHTTENRASEGRGADRLGPAGATECQSEPTPSLHGPPKSGL
jgi:hypothetical protein